MSTYTMSRALDFLCSSASIFDISGQYAEAIFQESIPKATYTRSDLRGDWCRVGKDMRQVIEAQEFGCDRGSKKIEN